MFMIWAQTEKDTAIKVAGGVKYINLTKEKYK